MAILLTTKDKNMRYDSGFVYLMHVHSLTATLTL